MTFNETFEELCDLYTEGKDYRGRTPEQVAAIDKKMAEFRERSKKFAKENPYTKSGPSHASPAPRKQEDCETCGCEDNPEYGHFDDKFSDYIDQYEDGEGKHDDGDDVDEKCDYVPCAEDGERIDKDRMKCNSPKRGGSKKFVVKACENGKEKIVRFGDPNMKIRKSNPKARKSFRARHKCDQKKSKFSAGYWSCKKW